jgi:hypothetical protein
MRMKQNNVMDRCKQRGIKSWFRNEQDFQIMVLNSKEVN